MSESLVSVILPVYNGEKTIKATVESILNQTYQNFELVACIDGTNDGSENILNSFGDSRIRVIRNPRNLGLPRTLNRLVVNTSEKARYVAMAEQDDWYYPERLQAQVEFLDANDNYGLVSGIAEHWGGSKASSHLFPGILEKGGQYPVDYKECFLFNFKELNKFVQTCMMFRKDHYFDHGMYFSAHYPSVPTDWDFVLRWCKFTPIHGLHKVLVRKDRRDDRESVTKNLDRLYSSGFELIRSYKYECAHIITPADYKYAWLGLRIQQIAHHRFLKRMLWLVWYFLSTPGHALVGERFGLEFKRMSWRLGKTNPFKPALNK